ncbi:MAG: hypothetical protein AMXMBFR13_26820 [Phycisphaerae bacterium]
MKTHLRTQLAMLLPILAAFASNAVAAPPPGFVTIQGDQFVCKGAVFKLKGTNYYPQNHMWADLWNSWDWPEITDEVRLIRDLGMNCVRILVPYSHGGWDGANPPANRLNKLEALVNEFGVNGVRSCVTLFDWETSFPATGTSTEANHKSYASAIVNRLKNNPYVFLWDVKNEPDHPANLGNNLDNWDTSPNKARIVNWLERMCNFIRSQDPHHPVSAGLRWWENVEDVIHFEDVAIFHSYWPNISTEQIPDVKGYMGANQKPILVEEFGWPSHPTPCNRDGRLIYDYNETQQLSVYTNHLTAFAHHNIAGGIQWMTFDAKPYTHNQNDSFEHFFGLWKHGYTLKPAGVFYRDHFPVNRFPIVGDETPPGPISGFQVSPESAAIRLTWTNPADADFAGTVIRRSVQGPPVSPSDGALVCERSTPPGATDAFVDAPPPGAMYHYAAFTRDLVPNYSPSSTASAFLPVTGDMDHDTDVDLEDFGLFQACLSGWAVPQTDPNCREAHMDADADVDMDDFALFQRCMTGANVRADPDCTATPGG